MVNWCEFLLYAVHSSAVCTFLVRSGIILEIVVFVSQSKYKIMASDFLNLSDCDSGCTGLTELECLEA